MMLYPEKIREKFWRVSLWAGVVLAALVPRLALLWNVERHLDADESIVGLMALHAARDGRLPAFFWGQHYGGGHVIEAALSAVLFKLGGGPSAALVQIVPMAFSVGLVVLAFAWVREIYGTRTAVWAALALSFSTPLLKSSLKADGYIETMFLCFVGLYLLHRLRAAVDARRGPASFGFSAALGFVFGLAWWSYDFSLIFALAAALVGVRRKLVRGVTHSFILGLGFLFGAAPILYDNLAHDFANVNHLAASITPGREWYAHFVFSVVRLVTIQLPAFLTRECVHVFVFPPPWEAWLYFMILAVAALVLIQQRARSHMPGVWALAPALYLLFYCATAISGDLSDKDPWNFRQTLWTMGRAPRYLLPVEPYMTLMAVAGLGILIKSKRPPARFLGIMAAPTLAFVMGLGVFSILDDNTLYEGNVKTRPGSIPAVVRFLKANNIDCVHTTYFIKWRILFESRETVYAMDIDILRGGKQGFAYFEENGCGGGKPPAFVFHRDSPIGLAIYQNIQQGVIPYKTPAVMGDHVVFLPVDLKNTKEQVEDQNREQNAVNEILTEPHGVNILSGVDAAETGDPEAALKQSLENRLQDLESDDAEQREKERILLELDEKFPDKPGAANKAGKSKPVPARPSETPAETKDILP